MTCHMQGTRMKLEVVVRERSECSNVFFNNADVAVACH